MKHRDLVITKIEQLGNGLTALDSMLSNGKSLYEVRELMDKIKEKLSEVYTLVNNQSDSWS